MAKEASGVHPDDSPEYQEFLDNITARIEAWRGTDEPAREFAARLLGQTRDFVRRTGRY